MVREHIQRIRNLDIVAVRLPRELNRTIIFRETVEVQPLVEHILEPVFNPREGIVDVPVQHISRTGIIPAHRTPTGCLFQGRRRVEVGRDHVLEIRHPFEGRGIVMDMRIEKLVNPIRTAEKHCILTPLLHHSLGVLGIVSSKPVHFRENHRSNPPGRYAGFPPGSHGRTSSPREPKVNNPVTPPDPGQRDP